MILSFILYRWSKKHSIDKTQAVQGATGSTALHVACANGCIKIVDLLLRNNARIDVKDKYGSTPLDVAQAKHETEIVKLLKAARENQVQHKHRSMSCSNDENESRARKSIDSVVMTHKRTASDKQPRIRRPSLPSIFEGHNNFLPQNIPSFISMTPSLSSTTNSSNLEPSNASSRRSFSAHRPLTEEIHSCPVTPRTSLEYFNNSKRSQNRNIPNRDRSPRSSEDSSAITYSTSPSQGSIFNPDYSSKAIVTADGQQPDWYAYGVINHYDDDNYLLSLERRAYNLSSNEYGGLERHSQEFSRRPAIHDDTAATHRRQSTTSSDDQQSDPYISTKRNDSTDSGDKLRTTALKNAMAVNNSTSVNPIADSISASSNNEEEGYEGELDDEEEDDDDEEVDEEEEAYSSEPLPRPSVVLDNGPEADLVRYRFLHQDATTATTAHERTHITDQTHNAEAKKGWFSGFGKEVGRHSLDSHSRKSIDFRPSFENFAQFAKRGVPNILGQDDDSSEDDERNQHQQQQRNGFFSRWAPAWSKK